MTIFRHELRRNRLSTLIWAGVMSFLMAVCALLYPMMKDQMDELEAALQQMGEMMEAFGASSGFQTFTQYIAVEAESILGLGGAIFAALLGSAALSREEKGHTAEFLLAHPVSRLRVALEKLLGVAVQILLLNVIIAAATSLSAVIAGERLENAVLFPSYFLLQLQVAGITFGLSALLRRGSTGLGIGLAAGCYFLNLLANLSEDAAFLLYLTPFSYAGTELALNYLAVGMALTLICTVLGIVKFCKKDIA